MLALSVVVVLASCNQTPTVTPNRENLMRAKKWSLSSSSTITVKKPNGKDTTIKYMDYLPDCYKDDYLRFDSNHFGRNFLASKSCSIADPEFENFTWRLWNNDNYIDLYDGFNRVFALTCTIEPYHFKVIKDVPLEYDTVIGRLDTIPGFLKQFIVLDTIRELRYTAYKIQHFDIYGAEITDFTESSFKLNFSFKTKRLDSTNYHGGAPNNLDPIVVDDTAHYSLVFTGS